MSISNVDFIKSTFDKIDITYTCTMGNNMKNVMDYIYKFRHT